MTNVNYEKSQTKMALIFLTIPLTLYLYVKLFGHKESEKLERMLVEAKSDWNNTQGWFKKNYGRLVKTMIVILAALLLLLLVCVS